MDAAEAIIEGLTNRILEALPFVVGVVVLYLIWRWIWGKAEIDEWGRETETNPRRHEIARGLLWFALAAILLFEIVRWLIYLM
jgi:polyferredoxin